MRRKEGLLYLDNAATTFPKPEAVTEAVVRCMQKTCGNPGRGSHRMAMLAAEEIYSCREEAAAFFGADSPDRVVMTVNATHALNTALKSIVRAGDHVLIGSMEHNAVARPTARLVKDGKISRSTFSAAGSADSVLADIKRKIRPETRVLICAHIPNIANAVLPAEEIGALCRARGIAFILDAAQSAGHMHIDVARMGVDMLCVPGHKGLYGPQGIGMIVCGSDRMQAGVTLVEGGSGMHSLEEDMPDVLPERFEAGTLPTPAAAGLREGIRFVRRIGTEAVRKAEEALWQAAYGRLADMPGVRLYDHTPGSVLLFNIDGLPPSAVGERLDRRGICVRCGYHCAPMAHTALGTGKTGGVRASFGVMNTRQDVLRFTDAVFEIAREGQSGV